MTFEEYNKKMNEYAGTLKSLYGNEWEEFYEIMSRFQQNYMENVLDKYQKTIDCEARECIYDLMWYAVKRSQSGSSIIDVETEAIADAIDNILWDEIGDYLLDYEIYEEDGHWVVNCLFAGNYVPYWDGWDEV